MYFVVGSGPTGIACTYALVNAGHQVTILDVGKTLEPERDAIRAAAAAKHRGNWTRSELASLRTVVPKSGSVPMKLVYGSDYPYQPVPGATDIRYANLNIRASYALGGLSNVWGSTILPFREEDLSNWPIAADDLAKSYREVVKLLPVSAQSDDIAKFFPIPPQSVPLKQSCQIKYLLRCAERYKKKLNTDGLFFGGSRLAVDAAGRDGNCGCYYCASCLHGCPRDLIYSTRQSIGALLKTGKVEYKAGIVVRSIAETTDGVRIHCVDNNGSDCVFEGERVFLGAGTLNTTAILLRSLGMYDHPVRFLDSQYYLFPMLQARAAPHVAQEELYTLSQAFIEILDKNISPYMIHLQVYSYNDHLGQMLQNKLGPFRHLFPANAVLGRLLLIQGYLHSDHSGSIIGALKREGASDVFYLEELLNSVTGGKIQQVVRKLTSHALNINAIPIASLLQKTEPGRGFHIGGSFPMAATPRPGQTDRLGRPHGMTRTHAIDATVFPSIPATTITLPAMINAYRIGLETSLLAPISGNFLEHLSSS